MSASKKPVSVRFEPRLLEDATSVVHDLESAGDVEMDLSTYIRYMVRFDAALWRRSPYVAVASQITALVGQDGRLAFSRVDRLRLNQNVDAIPCRVSMKASKVEQCLASAGRDAEGPALRSRWRAIRFDLVTDCGELIDAVTDPIGLSTKMADLRADQPAGALVRRRQLVVLDDHVMWQAAGAPKLATDGLSVDVTVPTLGLDLVVVVDERLYAHTRRFGPGFQPRLDDRLLGADGQLLDGDRARGDASVEPEALRLVGASPPVQLGELLGRPRPSSSERSSVMPRIEHSRPPSTYRTPAYSTTRGCLARRMVRPVGRQRFERRPALLDALFEGHHERRRGLPAVVALQGFVEPPRLSSGAGHHEPVLVVVVGLDPVELRAGLLARHE